MILQFLEPICGIFISFKLIFIKLKLSKKNKTRSLMLFYVWQYLFYLIYLLLFHVTGCGGMLELKIAKYIYTFFCHLAILVSLIIIIIISHSHYRVWWYISVATITFFVNITYFLLYKYFVEFSLKFNLNETNKKSKIIRSLKYLNLILF